MVILENEAVIAEISLHGAELQRIYGKEKKQEYLWYGDKAYWGRRSPVLFPIVGSLKDKTYRYQGKQYQMGQHGFARDQEFSLISETKTEAWFAMESTEETKEIYPFAFRLEIGYRLEGIRICVMWKVINQTDGRMYFSIGAHPAFLCPPGTKQNQTSCNVVFYGRKKERLSEVISRVIGDGGLVADGTVTYALDEMGRLPITTHLFDQDALVLENSQTGAVAFEDASGCEFIRVEYDAPLVGVWSPVGKDAPFVCIEPWYGRCDAASFEGSLEEREWGNSLNKDEIFEASYQIVIG